MRFSSGKETTRGKFMATWRPWLNRVAGQLTSAGVGRGEDSNRDVSRGLWENKRGSFCC